MRSLISHHDIVPTPVDVPAASVMVDDGRQLDPPRLDLLGTSIHPLTFRAAVDLVLSWAADGAGVAKTAHFCNVHLLVTAHDDHALGHAMSCASLNAMDGVPLVWMSRLLGRAAERVAGPDLMLAVMDEGRTRGLRHFLYGGAPGVAEELGRRLMSSLPGLEIVGTASPPFTTPTIEELAADYDRIESLKPDFVWVGLGAPKQDFWIEEARNRLRVPALLAVGAAFDFHSGRRRRAPLWMQRSGTEWLFRLVSDPSRLWRRYALTNTRFAFLAIRQLIRARNARVGQ